MLARFDRRMLAEVVGTAAGVDEAGRGALAGPLIAAAVILHDGVSLPALDDSKRLAPRKREEVYHSIVEVAECWAIGTCTVEEVDALNVYWAAREAMRRALQSLPTTPDFALVDGRPLRGLPVPCRTVIRGDACSLRIAAASVLAKVTRDRIMCNLDAQYPDYGFARHKGYATPEHKRALREHGPCPEHRRSFLPVQQLTQGDLRL